MNLLFLTEVSAILKHSQQTLQNCKFGVKGQSFLASHYGSLKIFWNAVKKNFLDECGALAHSFPCTVLGARKFLH